MKKIIVLLLIPLCAALAACSGNAAMGGQTDYNQTKKMVIDILKTDEGKKALQDIITSDDMKKNLVIDQAYVKETIEKTLTSQKGMDFWKESMKDPKFAEAVAKSMKTENKALLKSLMKDPDYQAMMIDVLKDPVYEKEVRNMLKSKEMRKTMQSVVVDTFNDPLFKAKMEDSLRKAAKETDGKK
ncbi:germination protein GerD [Weizmannia acidilactici]|uniref:Germination protein GerD n=1 Tax=Weizmannia acidilactici TaxID=2607726 RepID=A0A5J4JHI0_9BACI|nr:spore germination lipoprotein GerD [Weizmannia acidilactici]GER67216.1 germination protein GerD [Weizmannia acidilactici]GER69858.1 germination protein GerD [Weizmannia acidilactici]GER73363.1 germination protein GerD [Weizmannia acidilactici]